MPASFEVADPAGATQEIRADWWEGFGSSQLSQWLDERSRLEPRPAHRRGAGASRPRWRCDRPAAVDVPSLGASAGLSQSRADSENTAASTRRGTSVGLSVSYEVDLWGRIAAGVTGARAVLDATRYDAETARLSIATTVASTYFQFLATQERLSLARENLDIAERVLRVVEARARNGVATPLDVSQQTTAVLSQRTALLPLETQQRQLRSALAVLLGATPQGFDAGGETFNVLQVPAVAAGLPSSLLTRRPDLAAADADLVSSAANVTAARASLFPSIALSGSGGLSSNELASLSNPVTSLSAALSLGLTLFDAGRRAATIEVVRSQQRVAIESYAAAVRGALKEVDDGLGNADVSSRQEIAQQETVAQAQRTLRLAELRYREGTDQLLTVLDAQRTLFSAQDALIQVRLTRLNAALDLYLALGGGWQR